MFLLFCSKSFIKSNENKQTWIHAQCGESKLPIHDNCLPKYGKTFKIIELKECNNLGRLMTTTFASSLILEIFVLFNIWELGETIVKFSFGKFLAIMYVMH